MKFTIVAVSVPALRQCTSENVPDAADGTDDGKYSALWNHQGYEKCVSADGLLAAGNQDCLGERTEGRAKPYLIDNLNAMLRQILLLGESPQQNYFTANTEKMAEKLQKDHPEMDEQTILDLFYGYSFRKHGTQAKEVLCE